MVISSLYLERSPAPHLLNAHTFVLAQLFIQTRTLSLSLSLSLTHTHTHTHTYTHTHAHTHTYTHKHTHTQLFYSCTCCSHLPQAILLDIVLVLPRLVETVLTPPKMGYGLQLYAHSQVGSNIKQVVHIGGKDSCPHTRSLGATRIRGYTKGGKTVVRTLAAWEQPESEGTQRGKRQTHTLR